jgi:phosphatidylglycerophosphatase A
VTSPRPSLRDPAVLIATWFGAGYLPKAPGTWGSLAALPFAWVIVGAGGWPALAAATAALFALGCWASARTIAGTGIADPGFLVVDEVAGQWLVLLAAPREPLAYAIGFAAFRAADILKPWPVSLADRRVGGGFGVMLDDILAAGYGLIAMLIYRYATGH